MLQPVPRLRCWILMTLLWGSCTSNPPTSPEPETSLANDTEVNSAGMQSMISNATGDSTDALCSNNAFLLPLQLGQNEYSIAVTGPDPVDQVQTSYSCPLCISGPGYQTCVSPHTACICRLLCAGLSVRLPVCLSICSSVCSCQPIHGAEMKRACSPLCRHASASTKPIKMLQLLLKSLCGFYIL